MEGAKERAVILDSSSISALYDLRYLHLLKGVFKGYMICISDGVYYEAVVKAKKAYKLRKDLERVIAHKEAEMGKEKWILNVKLKGDALKLAKKLIKKGLGLGESEVIALAREWKAVTVIDDWKARNAARKYGVRVLGTLRILKSAHEEGLITKKELQRVPDKLRSINFRIEKELEKWLLGE